MTEPPNLREPLAEAADHVIAGRMDAALVTNEAAFAESARAGLDQVLRLSPDWAQALRAG